MIESCSVSGSSYGTQTDDGRARVRIKATLKALGSYGVYICSEHMGTSKPNVDRDVLILLEGSVVPKGLHLHTGNRRPRVYSEC